MAEFHFIRPYWVFALLPVIAIWWRIYRSKDARGLLQQIIDPHLLEHLQVVKQGRRGMRPVSALLLFWILCVAVLSGPTWSNTTWLPFRLVGSSGLAA